MVALIFSSCATDPEYKAWKKQHKDASTANPYGVPQAAGETGSYTPAAENAAPYQPLPSLPQPSTIPQPSYPTEPTMPTHGASSHTVVSGDSLWGLARKYNTTIESIQAANNLTSTNIRTGRTLNIPGR